jgi:hypothetical protein
MPPASTSSPLLRFRALAEAAGAAIQRSGPSLARGLQSGAGALELARDLASRSAAHALEVLPVLEETGVMAKGTAKRARRACATVENGARVAGVVASSARGVGAAVARGSQPERIVVKVERR